jgi:hypothetical protein
LNLLKSVLSFIRSKRAGWFIRLLTTLLLFYILFAYMVDFADLWAALNRLLVGWLIAATMIKSLGILAAILRWNLLLRSQGLFVPFGHLFSTFMVGRFYGTFLPSTLGLDGYRAYDIAHRTQAVTKSVAVIVVEKIIGFFALSSLVLATLPAGARILPVSVLVVIGLLFCLPVMVSSALLLKPIFVERLLDLNFPGKKKIEARLRKTIAIVLIYEGQRRLLYQAMALGLVVHASTALMYVCTALAIQAPVKSTEILFIAPLMITATVISPVIAGAGAREFTFIELLRRIGVSESVSFLIGNLGFWVAEFIPLLIGGAILVLRPAHYRPDIRQISPEAWPATASLQAPDITIGAD